MADDFVKGFEEAEVTLEGPFDPALADFLGHGGHLTVSADAPPEWTPPPGAPVSVWQAPRPRPRIIPPQGGTGARRVSSHTYESPPPGLAGTFDGLKSLRHVTLRDLNALVHDLLDLLPLPADELPLLRAVLLGDDGARGPLADMIEDKGDHARAERVRHPLREVK